VEANQGSNIAVTLSIEAGTDVASAPMQIQYDPKMLRLNDVVRGGFLSSDGQQPVFTKNILNDMGVASIQLNRQPGTPGVSGSGPLVTLNFQAAASGITTIAIPNLTLRNSQGVVIKTVTPQLSVTIK
jgi:general secretion pathway protein D